MQKQEKNRQIIYDLVNTDTKPVSLSTVYTAKKILFTKKKNVFKEKKGSVRFNKNWKEGVLTALATAIKNYTTISIRNQANELKIYKKTVRTQITKDLCSDLKHLITRYGAF